MGQEGVDGSTSVLAVNPDVCLVVDTFEMEEDASALPFGGHVDVAAEPASAAVCVHAFAEGVEMTGYFDAGPGGVVEVRVEIAGGGPGIVLVWYGLPRAGQVEAGEVRVGQGLLARNEGRQSDAEHEAKNATKRTTWDIRWTVGHLTDSNLILLAGLSGGLGRLRLTLASTYDDSQGSQPGYFTGFRFLAVSLRHRGDQ